MGKLEHHVEKAIEGDKSSLEEVVKGVQGMIYNLALRMLWHPEDAKDVTQEILIKIVTHLTRFEFRSSFKTWAYRVASNELLNYKRKKDRIKISFEDFRKQLLHNQSNHISHTNNAAERNLLIQEAKIGCSNAMLQCLNETSRLVYIIGEILELNSKEGAFILQTSPENFRKILSRARNALHKFLNRNCGIVNPENTCRCYKKVDNAIDQGVIHPDNLLFARNTKNDDFIESIEHIQSEVALYRTNPEYNAPDILLKEIRRIITTTGTT